MRANKPPAVTALKKTIRNVTAKKKGKYDYFNKKFKNGTTTGQKSTGMQF